MKSNVAYIGEPKFVSPFNDGKVYLTPSVEHSSGDINYIIVCCSPVYNGVYRGHYKAYNLGINGKKPCYYIPIDDCEFVKPLEKLENVEIKKEIMKQQSKGFKFTKRQKVPSGFMSLAKL